MSLTTGLTSGIIKGLGRVSVSRPPTVPTVNEYCTAICYACGDFCLISHCSICPLNCGYWIGHCQACGKEQEGRKDDLEILTKPLRILTLDKKSKFFQSRYMIDWFYAKVEVDVVRTSDGVRSKPVMEIKCR